MFCTARGTVQGRPAGHRGRRRIAVVVQVGGVVGKSNDTGVRQVTKVWVEVAEFAAIIAVVGGNLLPAIHARVDQGHDGGHLLLLLVDVRGFLVIRVV